MPIDPELLELFPHKVQIQRRTGRDKNTDPIYSAAAEYAAQVVEKIKRVVDTNGREVVSSVQAIVPTDEAISPFDKITLPDGSTPVILAIESFPDEVGTYVQRIYC